MMRPTSRRTVLLAAGAAIVTATVEAGKAETSGLRGTVSFAGGAAIPKGVVTVYLEDAAAGDGADLDGATTTLESDGKSRRIGFALAATGTGSRSREVVAELERADGWLVARGSSGVDGQSAVEIVLNAAIY